MAKILKIVGFLFLLVAVASCSKDDVEKGNGVENPDNAGNTDDTGGTDQTDDDTTCFLVIDSLGVSGYEMHLLDFDNNSLSMFKLDEDGRIGRMDCLTESGENPISISFNESGLIESMASDSVTLVLSNYKDSYVDIAVVFGDNIQMQKEVKCDINWSDLMYAESRGGNSRAWYDDVEQNELQQGLYNFFNSQVGKSLLAIEDTFEGQFKIKDKKDAVEWMVSSVLGIADIGVDDSFLMNTVSVTEIASAMALAHPAIALWTLIKNYGSYVDWCTEGFYQLMMTFDEWNKENLELGLKTLMSDQKRDAAIRALLKLIYEQTNGDNWTNNENWLSDKPVDEWYGVIKDISGSMVLILDRNNLGGSLDLTHVDDLAALGLSCFKCFALSGNSLTSINVSGCTSLNELNCLDNLLTSLDVSGCTSLTSLGYINNALLTSLNVSGCTSLTDYLTIADIPLTSLDVSGCTSLTDLVIARTPLTSLDVSGFTSLSVLSCSDNQLTSLDVSGCTSLTELECRDNPILTSLNVSGCTSLTVLNCPRNQLTSMDVSGCTSLSELSCFDNNLASLDVSTCKSLNKLNCYNNNLASLNVSGCTSLSVLSCSDNQLTSLDVSTCKSLNTLECHNNKITSEIPDWFSQLGTFIHDYRYTYWTEWNYEEDVLVYKYKDMGIGWWYPGEPEKGSHTPN